MGKAYESSHVTHVALDPYLFFFALKIQNRIQFFSFFNRKAEDITAKYEGNKVIELEDLMGANYDSRKESNT